MSHEDRRKHRQLVSGLMAAHKPQDEHERMIVQQLAEASWEMRRARAVNTDLWEHVGGSYNRGTAGIAEAQLQEKETRFRTHFRDRLFAQRQYDHAMRDLYRMLDLREKAAKLQQPAPAPKAASQETAIAAAAGAAPIAIDSAKASASRRLIYCERTPENSDPGKCAPSRGNPCSAAVPPSFSSA